MAALRPGPAGFAVFYRMNGGNDQLAEAMARSLGERVRFGAVVEGVTQDDSGVAARVNGETLRADRALFTIACSVAGTLLRDAKLSDEKERAIRELTFAPVTKVFLEARKRLCR